ncbi:hypothetical protein CLV60_108314 [Dyadobacter jiangsuensis]|uniref:HTH luxR-type domain-containing protein n=2 Tax=Dyadobacter jiangsuensis TaxID=1591085 RepID=A0A2P8G0G3_9BACT|nr:hypothetical protein CLV60_108314 [Dyadobacter jiangsuensis]
MRIPFERMQTTKTTSCIGERAYHTEYIMKQLVKAINQQEVLPREHLHLNERERQFVQLSCTDLTYSEVAEKMCVSPRKAEGYR